MNKIFKTANLYKGSYFIFNRKVKSWYKFEAI